MPRILQKYRKVRGFKYWLQSEQHNEVASKKLMLARRLPYEMRGSDSPDDNDRTWMKTQAVELLA